jgi:hypothetical protein
MRRLVVVLLLATTLAACESSKLDRAADVVVSGRVLTAEGAPAGGAPVALVREPSIGEIFTGLLVVPLTFGLACLGEPPAAGLCRGRTVERTVTGADGTYRLNLTGRQTQTAFGNTVDFTLSTAVFGATVTADFKIQTENLVLPDLQAWQPAVTVGAGRIGWDPPAPGSYQVVVEDGSAQLVWSFDSTRPSVSFDPRLLEDTAGKLAVSALTSAGAEGTSVNIRRQSARVDYRSTAGAPLSRGRPCTAGAPAAPVTPCPLTDGNFVNELPRPAPTTSTSTTSPSAAVPESTTIDLGRSAEVSFIVVRGCACQVERSTDGQTWTAVGRTTGYTVVIPSRTGPARFIRLTGPLTDLHEVSVWEGPAPAASTPAPTAPPPGAPPAVAAPAPVVTQPESRTVPALVALVLLVLALIGTAAGAFAVRRR